MKNVLVTGANGFIGKTLVNALLERNYKVVALDIRFDDVLLNNPNVTCISVLNKAIESIGCEGSVIELNWYGDQKISLNLGSSFHYERKKIISSQVSMIPYRKKSRWDNLRRKKLAINLLSNAGLVPPLRFKAGRNLKLRNIG